MRVRLLNLASRIRSSYWFIPSLMLLGAVALSSLTIYLDERFDFTALKLPFIYLSQTSGARALLSTVAGSMLSVASLTFSIVMVVLTMASSQFGPRLLGNFMRDRGNQFVLGTFISTFLYCLLVLRTVRGGGDVLDAAVFVPQLSVTVALVLAVVNLGAFIFFIHHTTEGIQAANVIAGVSSALSKKITKDYAERTLFPETVGQSPESADGEATLPPNFDSVAAVLPSVAAGYLRAIDHEGLIRVANDEGLVLKLLRTPGAFVMRGGPLLAVHPASALKKCRERLENKFALGSHRTPEQDLEFLFAQLLEVALRALSPGVNDPVTALMCIDRIGDNLGLLARRDLPSPHRFDDAGALRLVVPVIDPSTLVATLFGPIRSYGAADYMTLNHVLFTLSEMVQLTDSSVFRQALFDEAERVKASAKPELSKADYAKLIKDYNDVRGTVTV